MHIHHLNCATVCLVSRRLTQDEGGWRRPTTRVCHVLSIEGCKGLALTDTGFGSAVMEGRAGARPDRRMTGVRRVRAASALAQIKAFGGEAAEVQDILVTPLNIDHAGGLVHFPQVRLHVHGAEPQTTRAGQSRFKRSCYGAESLWHDDIHWQPKSEAGDRWLGFGAGRAAINAEDEVLLVPLIGHLRGHAGTAVKNGTRWLLHGRDAHFFHTQVAPPGHCPIGLTPFQRVAAVHNTERPHNQARLQQPNRDHNRNVDLSCAHYPHESRALQGT